jgi:hypothetical protein
MPALLNSRMLLTPQCWPLPFLVLYLGGGLRGVQRKAAFAVGKQQRDWKVQGKTQKTRPKDNWD